MNTQRIFTLVVGVCLLAAGAIPAGAQSSQPPSPATGNPGPVLPDLINLAGALPATNGVIGSNSLPPLQNIAAITAGWAYTCALPTGGGVRCWGDNYSGQLGDGTMGWRSTSVDVVAPLPPTPTDTPPPHPNAFSHTDSHTHADEHTNRNANSHYDSNTNAGSFLVLPAAGHQELLIKVRGGEGGFGLLTARSES